MRERNPALGRLMMGGAIVLCTLCLQSLFNWFRGRPELMMVPTAFSATLLLLASPFLMRLGVLMTELRPHPEEQAGTGLEGTLWEQIPDGEVIVKDGIVVSASLVWNREDPDRQWADGLYEFVLTSGPSTLPTPAKHKPAQAGFASIFTKKGNQ
jgi:hypothetical protein